jgi:hypothetical protein
VARQVTSTPGAKTNAQFSPDGKELFYLEQGRIALLPLDTRVSRPVAVTAEMDVDFEQEKSEVFQEAWTYLNDNFFDANFNGVDWKGAREKFAPYVAGARTPDELRRVISLMLGELNASHMGISAGAAGGGGAPGPGVAGKLGLRFDRAEYAAGGRLKVSEVIGLGPAAVAGGIKVGDVLTAVDGVRIGANSNLDELLEHKVGQRVTLTTSGSVLARSAGTALACGRCTRSRPSSVNLAERMKNTTSSSTTSMSETTLISGSSWRRPGRKFTAVVPLRARRRRQQRPRARAAARLRAHRPCGSRASPSP